MKGKGEKTLNMMISIQREYYINGIKLTGHLTKQAVSLLLDTVNDKRRILTAVVERHGKTDFQRKYSKYRQDRTKQNPRW